MEEYQGKSIFGGIAIGSIALYRKKEQTVERSQVTDPQAEVERFHGARKRAMEELRQLHQQAIRKVGEADAAVFETQAMMLEDDDYLDSVCNIIQSQQVGCEYAVAATGDEFAATFGAMEEEYFRARAADVKDISERVIRILQGNEEGEVAGTGASFIVAAQDLSPSETVSLDQNRVLAFVTCHGSATSHTAILARSMNIPALTGIEISSRWDGQMAIVDGWEGCFYVNPDEETLKKYEQLQQQENQKRELLQQLKGKDNVTLDGKKIQVYANIGNVSDVEAVLANDGGGIGLFRSEFLYLGRDDFPSEDQQFQTYRQVAENMAGRKVIIRTLDIGADKQVDYFQMEKEENPAMGRRAIRICLDRPEIFKTQLRAIYRASMYGTVSIMYPMITSVEEIREIRQIVEEVKAELTEQKIPFREVEQGIMIETPASVMISDLLAREVDFFSIGTNDLTQYTLAVDRQNPNLEKYFNPHHEAILRMIQMTIDNGHKEGCWVGICGELGADLTLTEQFLKMGIDELSVSASMILPVRDAIRKVRLER